DFPDKIIIRPGQRTVRGGPAQRLAEPAEVPERPLPGENAGEFRPLRPEDRERPRAGFGEMPKQPPPPAEPPPAPAPEAMPPGPWFLPDRPVPQPPNPNAPANDRLLALGKMAFADGEHARAEGRFRQAAEAAPKDAVPHFYLAQAQF